MTSTIQQTPNRSKARAVGGRRAAVRVLAALAWVVLFLLALSTVAIVSRYLAFDSEEYFSEQRETYLRHEFALGVHVLSGILALVVGPWQFIAAIRRRFIRVHRFLGAVYVASALALGLSGLVFAPTAYTGPVAVAGFTVLDLAMLFTTATAVRMIVARRVADHRRWMIRSFSLILAGVMLQAGKPDLRRSPIGWAGRLLLRDGIRGHRLALLGAEPAGRPVDHPTPA